MGNIKNPSEMHDRIFNAGADCQMRAILFAVNEIFKSNIDSAWMDFSRERNEDKKIIAAIKNSAIFPKGENND